MSFREYPLSVWSRSVLKRGFDFLCVFCALPFLIPFYIVVGLVVWTTSPGPVLFLQKRMGRCGRVFTILKFRTMVHSSGTSRSCVTTAGNQHFTAVGPFLRRWKLDELPQLLNVLVGQMSLVGPRPKMPEQDPIAPPCRPGVTGAATIVFAREEKALDRVPKHELEDFYNNVVLPAKRDLDAEYMARATFKSDLKLIFDSIFGRWDSYLMARLLRRKEIKVQAEKHRRAHAVAPRETPILIPLGVKLIKPVSTERDTLA